MPPTITTAKTKTITYGNQVLVPDTGGEVLEAGKKPGRKGEQLEAEKEPDGRIAKEKKTEKKETLERVCVNQTYPYCC